MSVTRRLLLIAFLLAMATPAAPATAPTLTEVQRLQVLTVVQRMQLAELRAQAAQRDWDAARAELLALGEKLKVPGYELDLSTQTYKPLPAAEGAR